MKRIVEIQIQHVDDPHGDSSYLGTYTDDKNAGEFVITRKNASRQEFRYFHATNADSRKNALKDYRRAEKLNSGDWSFIGVRAVATIHVGNKPVQIVSIASAGLWSIESDSGKSYLGEVAEEQLSDLAELLAEFGFTKEEIAEARKNVVTVPKGSIPQNEQFSMRD